MKALKEILAHKNNISSIFGRKWYKNLSTLLLFNTICFFALSILLPISFETNDDVTMLLISSGSYTGYPDAHLVFINYVYGLLLQTLYTNFPQLEWYTIFFSLIHILSITIISWCTLNSKKKISRQIIYLGLLYSIEAWIILNFQFTTTAAIGATAAIILLHSKDTLSSKISALLLFIIASLIRFDAAFLVLCVFSPFILIQFYTTKRRIAYTLPLLCFVICALILNIYDKKVYEDSPSWSTYREFNLIRGKINDNPNTTRPIALPPNISNSDYSLLLYFFPDTNIFDNNSLKTILSSLDKVSLTQKIQYSIITLKTYFWILVIISLIVIIQFIGLENRIMRITLLLTYAALLFLACYISLDGIFKLRVIMTTLLPFSWILFLSSDDVKYKYSYSSILASILILFSLYNLFEERKNHKQIIAERGDESICILNKIQVPEDELILTYLTAIRLEGLNPFTISKVYNRTPYYGLGWLAKIPFHDGKIDSFLDLIDKNMICVEKEDFEDFKQLISESILVNYNTIVDFEITTQTENILLIKIFNTSKQNY